MRREGYDRDGQGEGARERIHAALDGRLDAELSPAERAEVAAFRRAAEKALAPLPAQAPPDLAQLVMARVREASASAAAGQRRTKLPAAVLGVVRAAAAWLWAPRTISLTLRPGLALSGALALALALGALKSVLPTGTGREAAADARVFVHFRLQAAGATRVELAGDFTGWKPAVALHEGAPGVWSVAVPLPPGVHDYAFVVDGRTWRVDPLAPSVDDGFGGSNSRVAVMAPVRGRES